MKLSLIDSSKPLAKTDAVLVLALEGKKLTLPDGVKVPAGLARAVSGKFREVRSAFATSGPAERVVVVGLGTPEAATTERLRRACALASKDAEGSKHAKATLWVSPAVEKAVGDGAGRAAAEGAVMASYRYTSQKSDPPKPALARLALAVGAGQRAGAREGELIARANMFTRDLQNAPGNVMTPRALAGEAKKLARAKDGRQRVTCKVLDERRMSEMGMGSLLSVSAGSDEPARLVHLVYKPKGKAKGRVALVGKGLTFDAGGISIKPAGGMEEMKYDMSGGAAVLGVFHALANGVDVPLEVHGVVGCSENLINGKATKPGDVVRAMNGTTIEVLNTDAEGRLVLADCLAYVDQKVKPETVIDVATLTGAVITALGHELSGIFPSTESLRDQLVSAGESVGERVWPLPLLDVHRDQMKGTVADLRNINQRSFGNGSTAGAAFLANFAGDREWCHVDIAGTAWNALDRDWVGGSGGTGVGVRLFLEYLRTRA